MKLNKMAWLAAAAIGFTSGAANAQQYGNYSGIQQVSCESTNCDCGEPVCGCEVACEPACGCEGACDCEVTCDSGCDSMCGSGIGLGLGLGDLIGDCCLGEPYTLFGECDGFSIGGWAQFGYHSKNSPARFNNHADRFNLHQGWLYAEQAIDTSCGFDIGGRVDYVYGVDAQDTQAFGIANNHWDNQWDNGIYGHALPQAYVEMGYGDLSVKLGHFFTLIGNEVVPATGNFFYSHVYTMYNSEPFTHTGALATYNMSDDVTVYGGWTTGWDSGFENNGDNFLGGLTLQLTDDLSATYATTIGRFGEGKGALADSERGYMQSLVLNASLTDDLSYIFQTDYLDTEDSVGNSLRDTFDITQYLIYNLNDCWAVGGRFEWWNVKTAGQGGNSDVYDLTFGLNYRPHANVLVRPEVRWDWADDPTLTVINEGANASQTTFGIDTIFTF